MIYKICHQTEWDAAQAAGQFSGAGIDLTDGYIHFSTAAQAAETARLHFSGRAGLVLVAVDTSMLGDTLKWEASRGGDLFPHLYEALQLDAVVSVHPLPLGDDGSPQMPDFPADAAS